MSILEQLLDENIWTDFYAHKEAKGKMRLEELEEFAAFISEKRYEEIVKGILEGEAFPLPTKRLVNKMGNTKKRIVYTYPQDYNYVLKIITYLLYRYDDAFSPNLFSFRQKFGVKRAFTTLSSSPEISFMYSYKVDIHNYFNSIDIDICISKLMQVITDDAPLYEFITRLLREEHVIFEGEKIEDIHGVMAGVPIASFLANVYLREMDAYFYERDIIYARYSDDIIVFAKSQIELDEYIDIIKRFLEENKLEVNPKKEVYTVPNEAWTFLGIKYIGGKIDISQVSLDKVKAKMRRKSRALLRWKRKKELDNIYAVKAFIKFLNNYFYNNKNTDEMTWSRWYFPIITTDESLKAIDQYAVELIRYIASQRHNKSNYNLRYEQIKQLGYKPLVSEYYTGR